LSEPKGQRSSKAATNKVGTEQVQAEGLKNIISTNLVNFVNPNVAANSANTCWTTNSKGGRNRVSLGTNMSTDEESSGIGSAHQVVSQLGRKWIGFMRRSLARRRTGMGPGGRGAWWHPAGGGSTPVSHTLVMLSNEKRVPGAYF
jgi:hypothetical protein